MKKRAATHIQRKNCENRNTEKKINYQNSWVDGDIIGDIETKQPTTYLTRTIRRWILNGIKDMKCNTMDIFDLVKGGGRG